MKHFFQMWWSASSCGWTQPGEHSTPTCSCNAEANKHQSCHGSGFLDGHWTMNKKNTRTKFILQIFITSIQDLKYHPFFSHWSEKCLQEWRLWMCFPLFHFNIFQINMKHNAFQFLMKRFKKDWLFASHYIHYLIKNKAAFSHVILLIKNVYSRACIMAVYNKKDWVNTCKWKTHVLHLNYGDLRVLFLVG